MLHLIFFGNIYALNLPFCHRITVKFQLILQITRNTYITFHPRRKFCSPPNRISWYTRTYYTPIGPTPDRTNISLEANHVFGKRLYYPRQRIVEMLQGEHGRAQCVRSARNGWPSSSKLSPVSNLSLFAYSRGSVLLTFHSPMRMHHRRNFDWRVFPPRSFLSFFLRGIPRTVLPVAKKLRLFLSGKSIVISREIPFFLILSRNNSK